MQKFNNFSEVNAFLQQDMTLLEYCKTVIADTILEIGEYLTSENNKRFSALRFFDDIPEGVTLPPKSSAQTREHYGNQYNRKQNQDPIRFKSKKCENALYSKTIKQNQKAYYLPFKKRVEGSSPSFLTLEYFVDTLFSCIERTAYFTGNAFG